MAGERQCRPFLVAMWLILMMDIQIKSFAATARCAMADGIPLARATAESGRDSLYTTARGHRACQIGLRSGLLEQVLATRTVGAWTRH